MAIITISRGSASGGLMLAQGLGERLGYEVVGREEIVHGAAQFGVPEKELREAMDKPPSFWQRLQHTRRRYLAFVQAALCQRVQSDGVVYHGNAGHLLLHGVPHLLCVRLIAPLSFRVQQLIERQGMGEQEAKKYIESVDRERTAWTHFLYGVDQLDPHLYDLVISLEKIDVDCAVEMAANAVQRPAFATTEDGRRAMDDLLLASRVRATLAANDKTASAEVKVEAKDKTVWLSGKLRSGFLVSAVLDVAGAVDGVERLNRDNLDAPDFTV